MFLQALLTAAAVSLASASQQFYETARATWNGVEVTDVGHLPWKQPASSPKLMLLECMLRVRQVVPDHVLEQRCIVFSYGTTSRCLIGQVAIHSCDGAGGGQLMQQEEAGYDLKVFVKSLHSCWIPVQQRVSSDVDFKLPWVNYSNGFGNSPSGSFWLGLRQLHLLTQPRLRRLRARMTTWNDSVYWADYSDFLVGSEAEQFTMKSLGTFAPSVPSLTNDMETNKFKGFSTIDADNDEYVNSCSNTYHGGWWYKLCMHCNPNGRYYSWPQAANIGDYGKGIVWGRTFGFNYSLKAFQLLIW